MNAATGPKFIAQGLASEQYSFPGLRFDKSKTGFAGCIKR